MTVTSTNTGSAAAALNIVDYNENVYLIREGQIKNYIWDDGSVSPTTSGTWVKQTSFVNISGEFVFVTQSGMEVWVDISGDLVQLTSGTGPIRAVTLSGSIVGISGQLVQLTSGTGPIQAVTLSGSIVGISGQQVQLTSGTGPIQAVTLSGSIVGISGQQVQLTSGTGPIQSVTLSGSIVDVSGQLVQLTSGTGPIRTVTLSGSIVDMSGSAVSLTSGTALMIASGQFVNIGLATVSGLTSGFSVIASVSGTTATLISGNFVNVGLVTVSGLTSGFSVIASVSGTTATLISGSFVNAGLISGTGPIRAVTLSGSISDVSGATVSLTSGTTIGGSIYDYAADSTTIIAASVRVMNLSGVAGITTLVSGLTSGFSVIASVSGTTATLISGSFVNVGLTTVSGLTSGFSVIASVSGVTATLISGSFVNAGTVSVRNKLNVARTMVSNTALSGWVEVTTPVYFEGLTIHQASAPTTSGALAITITSISGAVFDTLIYSDGTLYQDFLYTPDQPLVVISGEGIQVRYPNTDNRNIGLRITTRNAE